MICDIVPWIKTKMASYWSYNTLANLYGEIIANADKGNDFIKAQLAQLKVERFRCKGCLDAIQKLRTSGILDVPYPWSDAGTSLMDLLAIKNGPDFVYLVNSIEDRVLHLDFLIEDYKCLLKTSNRDAYIANLRSLMLAAEMECRARIPAHRCGVE
jgi:hypothetical protein